MEIILADKSFRDICQLPEVDINMDIGETNDFEATLNRSEWSEDIVVGNVLYIPGTEYGGIFGATSSDGAIEVFTIKGRTWRGMLDKKILEPPEGEAYRTISGELNMILAQLVETEFPGLFYASNQDTGVTVTGYQFDRYPTLLRAIEKMLASVEYRIRIRYLQRERGLTGYIEVAAVPITDYSDVLELSQDSQVNFTCEDVQNGVNHLICLGAGELTERLVVHLYAQPDGSIGKIQFYKGTAEVAEVYENTNADTEEELEEDGREKLLELMNYKSFGMDISTLDIDIDIGDIIGGRDYLTGLSMKEPVTGKLLEIEDGKEKLEYRIKGEES